MDLDAMNAVIDLAHKATAEHGIAVRGGKKYAQVTTRVELFRRHFQGWGIDTEIVSLGHEKGQAVVMRARVFDQDGNVKGTGHASEIIGAGNVNTTSALENAETSAIGRALSCLGLHGGEYASLNEIEAVDRKSAAQAEAAQSAPDLTPHLTAINGAQTLPGLRMAWDAAVLDLGNPPPREILQATNKRKRELEAMDPQAPADPTDPPF